MGPKLMPWATPNYAYYKKSYLENIGVYLIQKNNNELKCTQITSIFARLLIT